MEREKLIEYLKKQHNPSFGEYIDKLNKMTDEQFSKIVREQSIENVDTLLILLSDNLSLHEKNMAIQYRELRPFALSPNDTRRSFFHDIIKLLEDHENALNKQIRGYNATNYMCSESVEQKRLLPYMLFVPDNMEQNSEMLVTTLNLSQTNKLKESAVNGLTDMATIANAENRAGISKPIMYIFIPDDKNNRPYYQQLSRECFVNDNLEYERIDLQVIEAIEDAKKRIKQDTGKKTAKKIILCGYSTSAVFTQRMVVIHPEIISKAIIGGAVGSIPIPTKDLEYPLGIKDFEELFKKEFNEKAYKDIEFAMFVGEKEAREPAANFDMNGKKTITDQRKNSVFPPMHDMSYNLKSVPLEIGRRQRNMLGIDLQTRAYVSTKWYIEHGYKLKYKIYKGIGHSEIFSNKYSLRILKDILEFIEKGFEGNCFEKDEISADKIDMTYQRKREENMERDEQFK